MLRIWTPFRTTLGEICNFLKELDAMKNFASLPVAIGVFFASPALANDCGAAYGGVSSCYSRCTGGGAISIAGIQFQIPPNGCGICDQIEQQVKTYCPTQTFGKQQRVNPDSILSLKTNLIGLRANMNGQTQRSERLAPSAQQSKSRVLSSDSCNGCNNGKSDRQPSLSNLQKLESKSDSISKSKTSSGPGKEGIIFQRDLNVPTSKPK